MTIVVAPSGKQGEDLFAVAKLWAELKLLSPSIWIVNSSSVSKGEKPPKQKALILGNLRSGSATTIEVDLFEQLARQSLYNVRLVVVRNSIPGSAQDEEQDLLARVISEYIDLSLPMTASGKENSDAKTNFLKLNLVTTTTENVSQSARKLVGPEYHANFIASTEDRSAPLAGDAFVRFSEDSTRFAGFTMMHLATIGALWAGLPQGLYELVKPKVWVGDKAYVSRIFMSAILTDGLARRAATRVLDRAANANQGFTDLTAEVPIEGTYPIPDTDTDAFLDYMVDQTFTFDSEILRYQPAIDKEAPEKYKFKLIGQIRDFLAFSVDKILRIPVYAAIWIWRRVVRATNKVFQGGDKGASVIPEPEEKLDSRDIILEKQWAQVSESKKKADEALVSPVTLSKVRSTPELWSNLRKLIFGMLDGSNLQNFGFSRGDNGWPIFYKVSSIFNDPGKRLEVPDPEDGSKTVLLSWKGLVEATNAQTQTFEKIKVIGNEISAGSSEIVTLNSKIESLRAQLESDGLALGKPVDLSASSLEEVK
jgi:hypothetical protein